VESASAPIDEKIKELGDWRGKILANVRQLIHDADPDIQEEWKWVKPTNPGTPVWSHDGCRGASIKDPKKLFNSSQEGNSMTALKIRPESDRYEVRLRRMFPGPFITSCCSASSTPPWAPAVPASR
jgi:hypothetical protein